MAIFRLPVVHLNQIGLHIAVVLPICFEQYSRVVLLSTLRGLVSWLLRRIDKDEVVSSVWVDVFPDTSLFGCALKRLKLFRPVVLGVKGELGDLVIGHRAG